MCDGDAVGACALVQGSKLGSASEGQLDGCWLSGSGDGLQRVRHRSQASSSDVLMVKWHPCVFVDGTFKAWYLHTHVHSVLLSLLAHQVKEEKAQKMHFHTHDIYVITQAFCRD